MDPLKARGSNVGILGLRKLNQITTSLYNFDLRIFAATTLMRRISVFMAEQNLKDVDNLAARLENDKNFFPVFQKQLIVPCTELFRDPEFWRSFHNDVLPLLENQQDKIRIWVPGCSSGEEALSTAIMLHEKNLLEKAEITVTGINQLNLSESRSTVYYSKTLDISQNNFRRYCNSDNADIYSFMVEKKDGFVFKDDLYKNIIYKVFDGLEMPENRGFHVVLCRNYFIYCTPEYQDSLLEIFTRSLLSKGFLMIGNKEDISFCSEFNKYMVFNTKEKIYRKKIEYRD